MRTVLVILCLSVLGFVRAAAPRATFTENKGQWPAEVLYRTGVPGGALFVEREAFTVVLGTGGPHRHNGEQEPDHVDGPWRGHAYRVHFVGGSAQGAEGGVKQAGYANFFLGNRPDQWGTGCAMYGEVLLKDVWPGIDLRIDGANGLKYEFILAPGADPGLIQLRYEGADDLLLKDGRLSVLTSVRTVTEEAPLSFQPAMEPGSGPTEVPSRFRLDGDLLTFQLPEGHDPARPLTIDPVLNFGSYSGSTGDNFGFTATYDASGHLYGGGNVFDIGYPYTSGALDASFNGGVCDIGISKWTPDGTDLVWSTYIGGEFDDLPHSMVVNANDELFVMGATGSPDFPVTTGAFDENFHGGPPTPVSSYNFPQGADLYVLHLNAGATALLGSTYVGGSDADGMNLGTLAYNYGDAFRGEIALNAAGQPIMATSTRSLDLPTVNAPQPAYGGGDLDGFLLRMDPALTTLLWATYRGGSGTDSGFGIQTASTGEIYVTGGTTSTDLPLAGTPFQPANSGGTDGYIARYAANGSTLLATTYLGTSSYDQTYFVQLDPQDRVFVVGQTHGNYPITPGKYANPGSSQFIHKLEADLSTSVWSTRIGNGNGIEDISPSAFLVSDCGQIFFSGWGGVVNMFGGNSMNSTTIGLPVSDDAYQGSTDGSDFYLMVLEPEGAALNYATFFGGGTSDEHVDGGTSRFDKNGTVYQAVCAGCGMNDDFPTTPDAWSTTNNSGNCNLGVFKFDLVRPMALISIAGPDSICFPDQVQFQNTSTGGNTFDWDFGDGTTSNDPTPTHTYDEEGEFTIRLILSDSYGCALNDTAEILLTSLPPYVASVDPVGPMCPEGTLQLNASDGMTWHWFPATGLSSSTIQDPVASPDVSTLYHVAVTSFCGTDTAEVEVIIANPQGSAMPDADVCLGEGVELSASGGLEFVWTPPETLSNATSQTPTATPLDTTTYYVTIISEGGCEVTDSVRVNVVYGIPDRVLVDTAVCVGGSVQLVGPLADSYLWHADLTLSALDVQSPIAAPNATTTYVLEATNVCGTVTDSAQVAVITVYPLAWPDTLVCPGAPVGLHASGGTTYAWSPSAPLSNADVPNPIATSWSSTTYTVVVTDDNGCWADTTVRVDLHPLPFVEARPDVVTDWGDPVQLFATGDGTLVWSPDLWLDCTECPTPWSRPDASITYTVTITDSLGCKNSDDVVIILNGTLYVPNTFTPNGDGKNDLFQAWGTEIDTFRMLVFNRWGEEIYRTEKMSEGWDGKYNGVDSQIDTYVWRVDVTELAGHTRTLYGHVNLVR